MLLVPVLVMHGYCLFLDNILIMDNDVLIRVHSICTVLNLKIMSQIIFFSVVQYNQCRGFLMDSCIYILFMKSVQEYFYQLQETTYHLTHLHLVSHICVSESGEHWFRWWLVAEYLGTNFIEILIKIQKFSFMKISYMKCQPLGGGGGDELSLVKAYSRLTD